MAFTAKRDIPGTGIRKGDKVDRATAERHGKGSFVSSGDDYREERRRQDKRARIERERRERTDS